MDTGSNENYKRTGVDQILATLKGVFGDKFKTYYNGDPEAIPESALPAITANITNVRIQSEATGVDNILETILIKFVLNKKDDFGAEPNADLTEVKLRRLTIGQDPSTGEWLAGTFMHTLRTQITLANTSVNQNVRVNYDVNLRPNEVITMEAWAEVEIERLVMVPVRN